MGSLENKNIAQNYLENVTTSQYYFSKNPVKDTDLLFQPFLKKVTAAVSVFNKTHPESEVLFTETYRSNTLQMIHFNNGASKIKKNGMHHYSIAVDCAFKINGKFTYNGDYRLLRECMKNQGLYLLGLWDMGHVQHIPVADQISLRVEVDAAVKKFQKDNGLNPDGDVGSKTIAKAKQVFGK